MIKRFAFSKRERYSDKGEVFVTIETSDNHKDTAAFALEIDKLISEIPLTDVNVQVLDLYESTAYKTPETK